MLRLLAIKALLAAISFQPAGYASRQLGPVQLAWLLKAWGSAQIVQEANHYWAEGYDGSGNYQGRFFDYWQPSYCRIESITGGDNQGTPIRIQWASPYGWATGCIPAAQSQFYGWTDGLGTYAGQNFYSVWFVSQYESYVFPRGGTNSRGTTTELY